MTAPNKSFDSVETGELTNVSRPNGHIERVEIQDTSVIDFGVPVPDTYTLEVYRWGVSDQDGAAPLGLNVALLDETRTVQSSISTTDSGQDTNVEASLANSSGGPLTYYLGIENGTGSDILASNGQWVTAFFAYQVVQ